MYEDYAAAAEQVRPFVADTGRMLNNILAQGGSIMFEGAQGTMLDIDHGTYPFVTSSSATAGGAATGTGVGPTAIGTVISVTKAYVTRVGEGPLPSEIQGPDQERVRELGGEYGTVTGRGRRCAWLDLVALRYAVRLNGMTSLALTKLDVLSSFAEIPVCVAYRLPDGSETRHFPAHQSDFHRAEPVLEVLPGWEQPLDACESMEDLPGPARAYVAFIEQELEVDVTLVGVGADRERVLLPYGLEAVTG